MIRRGAAALALLFTALLLYFAAPHHDVITDTAYAMAPAVETESRKEQTPPRASAADEHPCTTAHAVARAPRAVAPAARPRLAADAAAVHPTAPCPARVPTARDSWNPGAGTAPTPSALQTFRC